MSKRNAVPGETPEPTVSTHGALNVIERADSMAVAIFGLATTLRQLDASKVDDVNELLDWYTGFHAGSITSAIELLANAITSEMDTVMDVLKFRPVSVKIVVACFKQPPVHLRGVD